MQPVVLTTDRLILRAPTAADVDAITAACQDPEIPRWTTVPSPYSREDAVGFVAQVAQWWATDVETVWGIFAEDRLVGCIGLHDIAAHSSGGDAELGYWMIASARGRGLLTEAATKVLDWAFADLGLARIGWRAVVGNIPSARSARALGFRFEGTLRQALTSPRGRDDGWFAGLLRTDDRTPVAWPIPLDG
ncbi:RimJ/RimL family protein N-acetyltransferase [Microbacterium resistens]|uniref:RimJ/RimL family protein N-acetyltransferase n=1 Tax=Microbacterium resistens TaxID=156977 RepID=A0ABU1S9G1_9MICO|nr:GNAT family N-acetyltransferase [Microbacterium resistens]MDR6866252.1 RimJ/RimL family protein N-acetyltransferase [Microbacterium resistens]